MKKITYFKLLTIDWGLGLYSDVAYLHTQNKILVWIIACWLKFLGFKDIRNRNKHNES